MALDPLSIVRKKDRARSVKGKGEEKGTEKEVWKGGTTRERFSRAEGKEKRTEEKTAYLEGKVEKRGGKRTGRFFQGKGC